MSRPHRASLAGTFILALLSALTVGPAAHAQGDHCAVLTVDEVSAAYGQRVLAEPTFDGCSWFSEDASGAFVFVSTYWDPLPLAERQSSATGTTLTIGGRDAFYAEEYFTLYIQLDQGLLALSGRAPEGESLPALQQLGELVVQRAAQIPAPATMAPIPSFEPFPSFEADPELEALFPDSIAGEPLDVQSMTGDQLFVQSDDQEVVQQLEELLAAQGLALSDVSIGFGSAASLQGSITAARFPGADATAFVDVIIRSIGGGETVEQSSMQVAGKDVIQVTPAGGSTQYLYTQGDVIWAVAAEEPALTTIFEALP